jgi:hypothetical protein
VGRIDPQPGDDTLDEPRSTPPPPGLRAQFAATRDSAIRLAMAHVDLAKAEAAAIGMEIGRIVGLAVAALAIVLLTVTLLVIGTTLFTAEWLLGSMGWGLLHGTLLFVGIAVACVLAAVGVSGRRLVQPFVLGLIIAGLVSVVLAFNLPNQLYTAIGDAVAPGIEAGVRPLVVGAAIWGLFGLVGLIIVAGRTGASGGTWFAAALGGLVLGALFGAFTAITFGPQPAVALGFAFGYAAWTALMALDVSRTGVDIEALQARLTPRRTIETSKETIEWLQSRMPPGIGS